MWFPTRSDINRPVQSQKRARKKLEILELSTIRVAKTKVLISFAISFAVNREADLRLCFRLGRLLVFPRGGSFVVKGLKDNLIELG